MEVPELGAEPSMNNVLSILITAPSVTLFVKLVVADVVIGHIPT